MWHGGLKIMVEPCQAVISLYPRELSVPCLLTLYCLQPVLAHSLNTSTKIELYESAMQVGDAENAIRCCWSYCIASFYAGEGLVSLSKYFRQCIDESVSIRLKCIVIVIPASDECRIHMDCN